MRQAGQSRALPGVRAAFLLAQLLDVWLFDRLRHRDWWQAPFLSSLIGSAIDTALFFSIAFAAALPADANTGWSNEAVPLLGAGPLAPLWVWLFFAETPSTATLAGGAIAMTLADWLARMVVVPAELPIGIVTSLVGGPFLLWMLTRRAR